MAIEHTAPDCICQGKTCKDCETLLCTGNFYHDWSGRDGLRTVCRICASAHRKRVQREKAEAKEWQRTHAADIQHLSEGCRCEGKICKGCKVLLCVGKFYKSGKGHTRTQCGDCLTPINKLKYAANAEEIKANKNAWYAANAERARAYHKARYATHAGELSEKARIKYHTYHNETLERRRRWRREHPEQAHASNNQYKKTHPESIRARRRIWEQENADRLKGYRQTNRERIRQNAKRWAQLNREHYRARTNAIHARRRARKTQAGGSYTVHEWQTLKTQYNYTCLRCGRREPEIKLTADHIIPVSKGGTSNIDNIQPLCGPCNSGKKDRTIDYRPPLVNAIRGGRIVQIRWSSLTDAERRAAQTVTFHLYEQEVV
jgi:5-methylcytosine-specific restriction endonuclease McrA